MSLKTNYKVVIASDSFKNSIPSKEANEQILKAFKKVNKKISYELINISDGGEGFINSLTNKLINVTATNPIGRKIKVPVGILNDDIAVIELAKVSGIELIKGRDINANLTTTYGLGEVIKKVLNLKFRKIYIGLGGSATNDLGIGMLMALGAKFYDDNNSEVGKYGKDLFKIKTFDFKQLDPRLKNTDIVIAADVNNTLYGNSGASFVYGRQKGLKDDDLIEYDKEFIRLSNLFNNNYTNTPGAGAAGGLGYSLLTFTNGVIKSGFDVIKEITDFNKLLKDINILITGEGKIDSQTMYGKAPYKIASLAKELSKDVKVYAFAGIVENSNNNIFDKVININENLKMDKAIKKGRKRLFKSSLMLAKEIL